MLTSGMELRQTHPLVAAVAVCAIAIAPFCAAQSAPPAAPPSILDRLNAMLDGGKSAWTPEQLATMERLRDAAMKDTYALTELRHLTDNIGPRLSGSPQAQQAVEYVAGEMRALGAGCGDGRTDRMARPDAGHHAEDRVDGAGWQRCNSG